MKLQSGKTVPVSDRAILAGIVSDVAGSCEKRRQFYYYAGQHYLEWAFDWLKVQEGINEAKLPLLAEEIDYLKGL